MQVAPAGGASTPQRGAGWGAVRTHVSGGQKLVDLQELVRKSIAQWQEELSPLDGDKTMADGSINNLILCVLS